MRYHAVACSHARALDRPTWLASHELLQAGQTFSQTVHRTCPRGAPTCRGLVVSNTKEGEVVERLAQFSGGAWVHVMQVRRLPVAASCQLRYQAAATVSASRSGQVRRVSQGRPCIVLRVDRQTPMRL